MTAIHAVTADHVLSVTDAEGSHVHPADTLRTRFALNLPTMLDVASRSNVTTVKIFSAMAARGRQIAITAPADFVPFAAIVIVMTVSSQAKSLLSMVREAGILRCRRRNVPAKRIPCIILKARNLFAASSRRLTVSNLPLIVFCF